MYKIDNTDEFEKSYKKYKKAVKDGSGGLIETNKADYIKIAAFFNSLISPELEDYFKEIFKEINKKEENEVEDEFEYCEICKEPLTGEDDVYEGICNYCGDGNFVKNCAIRS